MSVCVHGHFSVLPSRGQNFLPSPRNRYKNRREIGAYPGALSVSSTDLDHHNASGFEQDTSPILNQT